MAKMSQDYSVVAALLASLCQDVMKSDNLLQKQGFVDSHSQNTVGLSNLECLSTSVPTLF